MLIQQLYISDGNVLGNISRFASFHFIRITCYPKTRQPGKLLVRWIRVHNATNCGIWHGYHSKIKIRRDCVLWSHRIGSQPVISCVSRAGLCAVSFSIRFITSMIYILYTRVVIEHKMLCTTGNDLHHCNLCIESAEWVPNGFSLYCYQRATKDSDTCSDTSQTQECAMEVGLELTEHEVKY